MNEFPPIENADRARLRELGRRYRDAVESPRNRECVRLWRAHDADDAGRPLILTECNAGIQLVKPDFRTETGHPWARYDESALKADLIHFEEIGDDYPLEPHINLHVLHWFRPNGSIPTPSEPTFAGPWRLPGNTAAASRSS